MQNQTSIPLLSPFESPIHSSMPSLESVSSFTSSTYNVSESSESSKIDYFFLSPTIIYRYALPLNFIPPQPDFSFLLSDWYFEITKNISADEPLLPPLYSFSLVAINPSPISNVCIKLPSSLFTHISLP